jgi:hypothetical protein
MAFQIETSVGKITVDTESEFRSVLQILGLSVQGKGSTNLTSSLNNSFQKSVRLFARNLGPKPQAKLIEYLATAGDWMSVEELCKKLGLKSASTLAGFMSGIPRLAANCGLKPDDVMVREELSLPDGKTSRYRLRERFLQEYKRLVEEHGSLVEE